MKWKEKKKKDKKGPGKKSVLATTNEDGMMYANHGPGPWTTPADL